MKLNTTRKKRDDFLANYKNPIVYTNYVGDLAKDCNVLEDELARVREELESARRALLRFAKAKELSSAYDPTSMGVKQFDFWIDGCIEMENYFKRFGGRE